MKRIILLSILCLLLVSCGGGGGSNNPSNTTQFSILDGTWNKTISNGLGGNILVKSLNFYNGHVSETSYLGSSFWWRLGTFSISGGTLTCNYTSTSSSSIYTSVQDILSHPSTSTSINQTDVYNFVITGSSVYLTKGGATEIFIK